MQTQLSKENVDFKSSLKSFLGDYFKNNEIALKNLWQTLYKKEYILASNSLLKNVLLTEMVCKFEPGIGLFLLTHFANIEIVKSYGSEEVKNKYLNKLISGEYISCFSLTEQNAGSDVSMIETFAKNESGNWIINGHKIWASNASISDIIILFAQTKAHKDKTGISAFIVDSKNPELKISKSTEKLGVKITPSNEITIKDLKVSEDSMIGQVGDGIKIALSTISVGRIFCAAQAIGLLSGILEESVKRSTERNQFGKSISEFQSIQWYIADMTKDLDAARLLLYKACFAKETNSSELAKLSSMCKYFSTNRAQKHSSNAVQIFGGQGLNENSYVAKAYKDSKVLEIYEGTNEIQKLIIAKELGINT